MGEAWRHIEVIRFVLNIGDLDRLSGRQRASERSGRGRPDHWVAPPLFNKRLGCAMQCNSPKPISFGPKQHAEFRLADTNGVLQHGLKHGGYLARRTRNHWRTSEVAVCCSNASESSRVRACTSS